MGNRKNLASRILRFPSFRNRAKSPNDQHKQYIATNDTVKKGRLMEDGAIVVVAGEEQMQLHQTKRNKELEEEEERKGVNSEQRKEEATNVKETDNKRDSRTEESKIVNRRNKIEESEGRKESERWTKNEQQQGKEEWGGAKLEKGQQNLVALQKYRIERGEKRSEKEQMTDKNEQHSLDKIEKDMQNVQMNGGDLKHEVETLQSTLDKLEQKLKDSNQERDYYKKHFKGENGGAFNDNGRGQLTDDFGRELMMANKRKYQLENRIKQLELELKESQQRSVHLNESVKSMEKLLWLEKERSAILEREREQLRGEGDELRRHGDALKRELAELGGPEAVGATQFAGGESPQEIADRFRAELEQRYSEMCDLKNKAEWRLGEVTQQFHDIKWRLGETEAILAHRNWELEQANNRIKQLELSVAATPSATLSDELERLKEELGRKAEENGKMECKLGEVNQWWNDAKWRVGELEAETAHRSHLLDKAHHRIGELERRLANNLSYEDLKREKDALEGRVAELSKTSDDAKWRVGELEAELTQKGELEEQKRKLEWRLGEMTQWWNDAKWRIGEFESALEHEGNGRAVQGAERKNFKMASTLGRLRELLRDGTLLIRKQPHSDRHKWKLLTFENALEEDIRLRRCWFEADSEGHREVFLIGSFVNWECALLCEQIPEKPTHRGIWLDLAPGRYEFRFLRDGLWHTEAKYGECWSDHGTRNNWMNVE